MSPTIIGRERSQAVFILSSAQSDSGDTTLANVHNRKEVSPDIRGQPESLALWALPTLLLCGHYPPYGMFYNILPLKTDCLNDARKIEAGARHPFTLNLETIVHQDLNDFSFVVQIRSGGFAGAREKFTHLLQ